MSANEQALREAMKRQWAISAEKVERERVLRSELAARLEDEFGGMLREANEAIAEAQKSVDAERVASAAERSPYPIGTVLYLWKDFAPRYSSKKDIRKTDEIGVVEVFTADSEWPANRSSGKPSIGDIVIRPRTKSGKPAAVCHVLVGQWGVSWESRLYCAEGERPSDREKRQEKVEIEL